MTSVIDIAIDIETTSTAVTAGVWEIGLVAWERGTDPATSPLTTRNSMSPNGTMDLETLDWMKEYNIYDRFLQAKNNAPLPRVAIPAAFEDLAMLLEEDYSIGDMMQCHWYSWGQFDFPIMTHQMHMIGMELPWHYRKINCFRSILNECGGEAFKDARPSGGHDAMRDAISLACLIEKFRSQ